ncbi:pentapeptide repeat-containing protein [Streptomyces phytohabitans]|uniref:pentapeptide repeat-containing protein n=1 Tax=Streptomyces phytohabitans TaxID=1150371 RepID=UPI00345C3520
MTSPSPVRPGPTPARRGEPGRDDTPSHGQGLDWARRTEVVAVVLGVLLSPLLTAAGLWYANNQVRDQLKLGRQELNTTQEGQITDRYSKAVENLGDDAIDVRLGGAYALQRIMQDSPRDHPTIANVLATYVRTHARKPLEKNEEVPADVHAALNALIQRDTTRDDRSFTLDLQHTQLPGTDMARAKLTDADLTAADLTESAMYATNLTNADLRSANLNGANMGYAKLNRAHLSGADLNDAGLMYADLNDADLIYADLNDADLSGAKLSSAKLNYAKLYDVDLDGSDLNKADLRDVKGLRVGEVVSAEIYSTTLLPPNLAADPAVKARIAEVEKEHGEGPR